MEQQEQQRQQDALQRSPELHGLADKLTAYIKRMRDLRSGRTHVDSLAFFQSVEAMEKEMTNLKSLYEREMDKMRHKVEELGRQKHHYQLQAEKNESLGLELRERMSEEAEKARKAIGEANSLQLVLREKDVEVRSLMAQTSQAQLAEDSHHQGRRMDEVMRENMDIKHRYEAEQLARREEEDKRHQLLRRMKFEQQLYEQRCRDLQQRIDSSTDTILELESRLRSAELPADLASILEQVRDAADRELQRYKAESEETLKRTVNMLKAQMEADSTGFHALASENRRLLNSVEELNAANHRLQSEVSHLQHLKRSAEENLVLERANAEKRIVSLESKLKDFQGLLFEKLKEFGSAREAAPVLRTEIDSLRRLLQDEQAKSLLLPPVATHAGQTTTTLPPVGDENRDNPLVREAYEALAMRTALRSSSAAGAASGRVSPRRPLSGGPVGPITAIRPTAPAIWQDSTASEVNVRETMVSEPNDDRGTQMSLLLGASGSLKEDSRPPATATYDYNLQSNSATGDIKIFEVHPNGKYVRLRNNGLKDADISGYVIQQSVGGHPVAVYRFPSRTPLRAGSFVTVHSGSSDPILHQPPGEFVWTEQEQWGTGPECTTIVCKPSGQAVAWTTAAHRFGSLEYPHAAAGPMAAADRPKIRSALDSGLLPVYQRDPNKQKEEGAFLRRERTCPPPTLTAQKHPHGEPPSRPSHPSAHLPRPLAFGNDSSSNNPQARSQSQTPDPIPGQPYAGASGQRMGSANLLRFVAMQQPQQKGNIRKSGALTKQADGTIRYGIHTPFSSCSFATELRSS